MSDFFGVRATEKATAITAPVTAPCATMAFGTAPVHQTDGASNKIVLAMSYDEAVEAVGWSDDWEKYTLCEVIHSHFKLYGVGPLLLVNVLNPKDCRGETKTEDCSVINGQITLSGNVIPDSVTLTNGEDTYTRGEDYDLFFTNGKCVIEAFTDGNIPEDAATLSVSYSETEFELDDLKDNVIGGHNVKTGISSGIELADQAYFQKKYMPDILIAPGFSHHADVAAVLSAKARCLSIVFRSFALCDLDADRYQSAVSAKNDSGAFQNVKERMCWPMLGNAGRKYHFSTQLAGLMSLTSANDGGIPSEPASNKALQADSAILPDGSEVPMDLNMANYIRGQGITTALNFVNGLTAWGEYCACVPGSIDPKDKFCNVARMVNYISNTIVLTFWSYSDQKLTPRLAASICDMVNIWLNGLTNSGHLLGGRCELLAEENSTEDLLAGIIRPHVYIGVPVPAQAINFIVEYDISYLETILG